jgi:hypothetical protein
MACNAMNVVHVCLSKRYPFLHPFDLLYPVSFLFCPVCLNAFLSSLFHLNYHPSFCESPLSVHPHQQPNKNNKSKNKTTTTKQRQQTNKQNKTLHPSSFSSPLMPPHHTTNTHPYLQAPGTSACLSITALAGRPPKLGSRVRKLWMLWVLLSLLCAAVELCVTSPRC